MHGGVQEKGDRDGQGGGMMQEVREVWSGNRAVAESVKRARVQVVSAYPITPQSSVMEYIAKFIHDGELDARMIRVESEHSALSAACGSSLSGARTFTATSSQGLMLMAEVLFFASGLRLPVVMALPNRCLESPVNIWSDHQDSLAVRDSGWIQLYASDVQEVHDMTVQAFKLSEDERILLPSMICYEGFLISHVSEVVNPLPQDLVDEFLPEPDPKWAVFDIENPFQVNELLTPEGFPEYRYKQHKAMLRAVDVYTEIGREFARIFGREYSPVRGFMHEDADVLIVGIGSIMSTARQVVKELRERGEKVGTVELKMFRPFPEKEFRELTENARILAVMDKDIGFGSSGMVYPDITRVWYNRDGPSALNFIVGLGGREVVPETIHRIYRIAKDTDPDKIEEDVFWPDTMTEVID